MSTFGWIADTRDPPWAWDLRRLGWALCREDTAADRRHAVLLDARALSPWQRARAVRKHPRPSRLLALGVELTAERASLIELGCAEALSANIGLHELEKRARRAGETIPVDGRWGRSRRT